MTRLRFALVVIGVSIITGAIGFYFGFREGALIGLIADWPPRAAISLNHLRAIESGKTKNTVIGLEGDIDNALIWSHYLDEYPLQSIIEPIWNVPVHANREYLPRLANYRATHLSPLRADALTDPAPNTEEEKRMRAWLIQGARENEQIIQQMIERYGDKKSTK
jgi:hypothetical protein